MKSLFNSNSDEQIESHIRRLSDDELVEVISLRNDYQPKAVEIAKDECKKRGIRIFLEEENKPSTKKCPFCLENIKADAKKCKHCGEYLDVVMAKNANVSQTINKQKSWNPALALILSIFLPGLGHLYKRKVISGIIWFIIVVIGYIMFIVPGIILHILCIISSAIGNTNR